MNDRIRAARLATGKSQLQVAAALGINQQAVSKWERGTCSPSARRLADLAALLDTTVDALLTEQAA